MKFAPTDIDGVTLISFEPKLDERGIFARIFCEDEFSQAGIAFRARQINTSSNTSEGTLRGLHWQDDPHAEDKVVQVLSGSIYDVAVDLRRGSPGFKLWTGMHLNASSGQALYIPKGCGHGFLTTSPDTIVMYYMGEIYSPGHECGARWDDPAFQIEWPAEPRVISDRDLGWKAFKHL